MLPAGVLFTFMDPLVSEDKHLDMAMQAVEWAVLKHAKAASDQGRPLATHLEGIVESMRDGW